nr:MAG TPA: hypothetical protein [Caudoviricetes sp.]DAQ83467.1 MAG TPA: hypothetical protein [Caudoviricetes sp.]DAT37291.1 MAG TPA: hypothetical protein [Caudoviricetes sp.]
MLLIKWKKNHSFYIGHNYSPPYFKYFNYLKCL